MTTSFRKEGGGFNASAPMDAMWEAMDQLKAGFDRRVGVRMGRGDVRAAVLVLLAEEPMHGYQIIREIEARTDGRWKPSAGSVYPTLQMLADEGVVTTEIVEDRKVYTLTEAGQDEAASATAPWVREDADGNHFGGPVPKAGFELAQAAAQAARAGTAEQQAEVAEALDAARRKIYMILAQD
ncbi:PadR family transcriptional regulator [Demequina mangrovi]|uniref:Transcriptional regulator, PadR family n=1 Tax=Demequina mangrovi TaxID=1043493 RepID=A0A1H7BBP1_9MICO|nr:PadR family transcriptional regulator [Demequina mangrovi]SEJ71740.1 transcriptional regulator, PadR family [Demequina mangrovi]